MMVSPDALCDTDHPMKDDQLVLNLLCGVNPRFSNTDDDIANAIVFPDFTQACDMLLIKELCLGNDDKVATGTALIAASSYTLGRCQSASTALA